MPDTREKLVEYFCRFPGVGRRQAKRFVYFLLSTNNTTLKDISDTIKNLKNDVHQCPTCRRFFINHKEIEICELCDDKNRDPSTLLILEKDMDLEKVNKNSIYNGHYFILGGLLPILEKDPKERLHLEILTKTIESQSKSGLKEIILALSASTEGDNTAIYLKNFLKPKSLKMGFVITQLGRGLSTGTELEYSDSSTIKSALANRA